MFHDRALSFPPEWAALNVALAHDWLTGMRGGERVLDLLCRAFPRASIHTLICRPPAIADAIRRHPIRTSWLQRLPGVARYYRYGLPLFPSAIEAMAPPEADLLVSLSHCVAKGLRPRPGARHLCYCFTPMRYAWTFYGEYFGANPLKKALVTPLLARLKAWDCAVNERVDRFVTLSQHVRRRIREFYGRDADVVYPPADIAYWTPDPDAPAGPRPGRELGTYDLIVSALVPYKRLDLAVRAYTRAGRALVVAGIGTEAARLRALSGPTVQWLGWAPDERIRDLYRHCRALIFPGEEDFGLVPLEAQACGRPVVAFARGGVMETVLDKTTGVFFHEQTEEALLDAVTRCAEHVWDPAAIRAHAEQFGPAPFLRGLAESIRRCLITP